MTVSPIPTASVPTAPDEQAVITGDWGDTYFRFEGSVPDLDGPAAAWYFPERPSLSDEEAVKLAALFGVTGTLVRSPDPSIDWVIRAGGDANAIFEVDRASSRAWSRQNGFDVPSAQVYCPTIWVSPGPDPAEGSPMTSRETPTPTTVVPRGSCLAGGRSYGVPSTTEARALGTASLAAAGVDLAHSEITTSGGADTESSTVRASLTLDGAASDIDSVVTFGAGGVIVFASGFLNEPVRGPSFQRVGVAAALASLPDAALSPALITPATCDEGCSTEAPHPPNIVTLRNARASVAIVRDSGTVTWVLPAYSFDGSDGAIYRVFALSKQTCIGLIGHEPQAPTLIAPG